jgi:hypothetical protein
MTKGVVNPNLTGARMEIIDWWSNSNTGVKFVYNSVTWYYCSSIQTSWYLPTSLLKDVSTSQQWRRTNGQAIKDVVGRSSSQISGAITGCALDEARGENDIFSQHSRCPLYSWTRHPRTKILLTLVIRICLLQRDGTRNTIPGCCIAQRFTTVLPKKR